jgi:pSer/pThr/pTyr-binding forkhead associated (FHA) protein
MHGGMVGGMQPPPGQPQAPYGAMAGNPPPAQHQVRRQPPPPGNPPPPPMPTSRRPAMAAPPAQQQRAPVPQYREPVSSAPTLYLIYNGHRYPISKDQFIIGRGSKTSDLAIKDGNISRKHAAVIRRNGTYYIKDLGSTNGIDYKGMRIDNKRVDEGDVFHICDYELRFTYRPD